MPVLLIIVSLLLAVALFIAGAIWRGRTTSRSATIHSRESVVAVKLPASGRGDLEEASACVLLTVETRYFDD